MAKVSLLSKRKPPPIPDEQYIIRNTGCHIKLVSVNDGTLEFMYLNRANNLANGGHDKPNFVTNREQINKQISFELWKPYSETLSKQPE